MMIHGGNTIGDIMTWPRVDRFILGFSLEQRFSPTIHCSGDRQILKKQLATPGSYPPVWAGFA